MAWSARSAAGHAHVPTDRRPVASIDDEVVALGLAGDGVLDGAFEALVALRGAKRRAQVGRILLAQAHEPLAGAGEAHPIAALAEVMGHRRNEAELSAGFLHPDISGRPARAFGQVLEGVS